MPSAEQILQSVRKSPRIPAPSHVVSRVLALSRDPNCNFQMIADAIQRDAALTGEVLRQANSALYAGAKPTSSVKEACVRLGVKRVRAVAINDHVISGLGKACPKGFEPVRYWQGALATSVAARDLASKLVPELAEDAGTAGLLVDVGIGLLAYGAREAYAPALKKIGNVLTSDIEALERQTLGLTHSEVGFAVLSDWKLDAHICEAVRYHHACEFPQPASTERFARIIAMAVTCSRIALCGSDMDCVGQLFEHAGALTSNPDELVAHLVDRLVAHIQMAADELRLELGETDCLARNIGELAENLPDFDLKMSFRPMERHPCLD